jgi:hypothetical protein
LASALALVAAAAIYIHFNGWNWARRPLSRVLSARWDRPVAIAGDLDVGLGWRPRLTAADVTIGNPGGRGDQPMLAARQVDLRLRLMPLFAGRMRLESLELEGAQLEMEKNADGEASWRRVNRGTRKPGGGTFPLPRDIRIADSRIDYRDRRTGRDLAFEFDRLDARGDENADYAVRARGRYNGHPLALGGVLGPWEVFWRNEPYPLRLDAVAGDTRAHLQGRLSRPRQLDGLSGKLQLRGRSLDELWAFFSLPLAETPPYRVAGRFTRDGSRFGLHAFSGKVGRSDLRGTLTVDLRGAARSLLRADLRSRRMDVGDFKGFWGAQPAGSGVKAASGPVFPDRSFDFGKLRAMDADVNFRAASVRGGSLLDDIRLELSLENGKLHLAPLDIGFAGGRLHSRATIDASTDTARLGGDLLLQSIDLPRLLRDLSIDAKATGVIGGRARLATGGNSLREMARRLDGDLGFVLDGGQLSETVLELVAIDFGEALVAKLYGSEPAPIHCLIGTFDIEDGRLTARNLLMDTDDVRLTGEGTVDLAREQVDLTLHQHPKDFSIGTLRSPIDIEGGLRTRRAHVRKSGLARRAGAALALGALVHPLAALLPLVELGRGEKPGACAAALADLRSIAASPPPNTPAPGRSSGRSSGRGG